MIIFLDLKRAFETVDRERMIMKLNSMGIHGNELKWFKNYLSNRKQNTKFNDKISNDEDVPIGLPQGTALSVLLFILYINDIVKVPKFSDIVLFADDTTITIRERNIENVINMMNSDLNDIFKWLHLNKLMLNAEKTKCMILSKKSVITDKYMMLGGCKIERVNNIKYLGIIVSDNLKLTEQVKKCVSKAAMKVNMLKRTSRKLTFAAKKMIFNTLVQPNFDYCSTLYLNASKEQIKSMQKIQNRGMRTILKCDFRTPKIIMLNSLGWLSISQRIKFNTLVMIFKIKIGLLPDYLSNEIKYVHNVNRRTLRNSNDFRLPNFKANTTRNSIFYEGLKMFNSLPNILKELNSLVKFKSECKKFVKENYPIS